ncbi:MAG: NUDIX hydrolase [Bacteroidetes bacterium]|nr:NUDIX hydrolase [Bacteroidota bacterium]
MEPKWLEWAKSLQAEAQNGLTFTENEFERERYKHILEIAAEMMASNSDADLKYIKGLFENVEGYMTPRVDVRGIVFKGDKILLVKEKSDGGWTLPGGWADPNETPGQSVEREVLEESGFEVKAAKVLAVFDRAKQGHTPPYPYHIYKLFFLCKLKGGKKTTSIETDGVDFFEEANIPALSTSRTTASQIKRFFEHNRYPELPADFD